MKITLEISPYADSSTFDLVLNYDADLTEGAWSCLPGKMTRSSGVFEVTENGKKTGGTIWLTAGRGKFMGILELGRWFEIWTEKAGKGTLDLPWEPLWPVNWRIKAGAPKGKATPAQR